ANGKPSDVDYYTCTMHPSVRSQDPDGKCPICGMDLVPVMKKLTATGGETNHPPETTGQPSEFTIPIERQQQIGVTYATLKKQPLHYSVRTVGTVASDEQRRWEYVPRVD